ncbi:DUF2254 domain-containing protein [Hymenobacter sp.]|uniref:DUF2254 domain-containing protein n=1 Tax=Hymenobacter sp. TaxID=1898978 RepID=UPI002869EFA5|nr:DUF2254 domain-containing protein [Hymenobacter sp.]
MRNRRLGLALTHLMYNLRGGFLVRPLLIALSLGAVGAGLSTLEEGHPRMSTWVPALLFPSNEDPQTAQLILSSIATSMMTVVSIVFAILLMTLTLASMQFSPRIIVTFVGDRVTQQTLGIFLGTFLYCLAALPAARTLPAPFSPVLTVLGAMGLAVACVGWLLYFINHISQAISVNHIVDRLARETEAMIDGMMPKRRGTGPAPVLVPDEPGPWEAPVLGTVSGYVRTIDTGELLRVAKANRLRVRILRRVGHFVPAGVPLLTVSKGQRLTPELGQELHRAFQFGPTRTLEQDIEYGILQIVDIALKAISPAVNDPSTAVSCVDQLSSILIRFASRSTPPTQLFDPPGTLRVSVSYLGFDRLAESAFEQIRTYSRTDVAVSLRLMRAFTDIAWTLPEGPDRHLLAELGRRLVAGFNEVPGEDELKELRHRLGALENLARLATDSHQPENFH